MEARVSALAAVNVDTMGKVANISALPTALGVVIRTLVRVKLVMLDSSGQPAIVYAPPVINATNPQALVLVAVKLALLVQNVTRVVPRTASSWLVMETRGSV
jgi:hypothetical protein